MAGEQTIDQLNIEINTKAKQSSSGMDKLIASIEKLKSVTGGGVGELTGISASLSKLTSMLSNMKGQSGTISSLANSIDKLNSVKTDHISSSIKTLTDSLKSLGGLDPTLKTMISDLGSLARSGGGSVAENALSLQASAAKAQAVIDQSALKSAKAKDGLNAIAEKNRQIEETASAAAAQEQELTDSINRAIHEHINQTGSASGALSNSISSIPASALPDYEVNTPTWPKNAPSEINVGSINALKKSMGEIGGTAAAAMNEVSNGSSRAAGFVDRLKASFASAKEQISGLGSSSTRFFSMGRFYGWYFILRQIANTFGGWISNINSYIENVNLFDVAMGSAAQSGEKLAQSLQNVLGVDSGEAMRYMGVFEELGTSFGIANKQATTMSENMTQLGYDLASFYNISTGTAFEKLESVYTGQSRAARSLGIDISNARLQQELYNLGINEKVNNLTQADKAELRYIAIMKQTTNAQGDMARTIQTPANALRVLQAQLSITGRAIGSIFIPALEAILPVVTAVIEIIGDLASELASLVGFKMPKIDYSSLKNVATDADDASTAVSGIGDSASKSKKQLDNLISGFDELNIIQASSDDSSSGSGSGSNGSVLNGIDLPSYDALKDAVKNQISDLKGQIKKDLADITAVVSGALLAVGAILVLTGANIPLGLGLMVAGVTGLAVDIAVNWDTMTTPLLNTLTTITSAVGGFLLALGAIMAFSGANIPLGIGLMAAGAISLATSVGIDWNSQKTQISTVLSGITGLISGASLAVGGMLTFTGANVPLGLGLMAVGAVGLASAVALNWSSMDKQTKETLSTITATMGSFMLAIGALLTLSGASPMLGIPMMVTGASTLATTIAVNWDSMDSQLRETLTTITTTVGGFSLALGAALAFSGANIPLGIGLMAAGAASLAATAAMNWNSMATKTLNAVTVITEIVSGSLLALGALLTLSGANIPLGIGMMVAGGAGLAKSLPLNWDSILQSIKTALSNIETAWNNFKDNTIRIFSETWENIQSGVTTFFTQTLPNFFTVQIPQIISGIVQWFTELPGKIGYAIGFSIGTFIKWSLDMIQTAKTEVPKIIDNIITFFKDLPGNIYTEIIRLKDTIAQWASDSVVWVKENVPKIVNGILDFFNALPERLVDVGKNMLKAIWNGICSMGNWLWDRVEDFFGGIGKGLADALDLGNGSPVTITSVPRFATGGIITRPTYSLVGESGPEAIVPLSDNSEWIQAVSASIINGEKREDESSNDENDQAKISLLIEQNNLLRAILQKDTTVNLDGKKISENTNKHNANKGYNLGLQT